MLAFLILWRMKKFKEASSHLEYAASVVNSLIKDTVNFSQPSVRNLYGLVIMGLAGLTVCLEKDWKKAISVCEDGLSQLSSEQILVKGLI